MDRLPVYQLLISDNEEDTTEVDFVSLVDKPAIERNFLTFSEQQIFSIQDEEQQIVTGPAMVPDVPLYRRDHNGEYYVVFSAETIRKISYRFFKKGYQGNINLQHEQNNVVADSVFYESWIVDRSKGKQPLAGFEDMPDGSWFLTAKINNPDTWKEIKSGVYKGFSVEGMFQYKSITLVDPEQELLDIIQSIVSRVK